MAVNDFTGKNIQDTYKRVVQTDGTNLADGTGSLLPISFDGNNVIISGSLIATEYIVSSSVTNILIATLSGSTEFGNSQDDIHHFTGSVGISGSLSVGTDGNEMKIGTIGGTAALGSSLDSANYALSVQSGHTRINASSNSSTGITFRSDNIERMRLDATGRLGIGTLPSQKLDVDGTIKGRGSTIFGDASTDIHTFTGNVTASGNISASGTSYIQTPELRGVGTTATLEVSGIVSASEFRTNGTGSFGRIHSTTDISASGNIIANVISADSTYRINDSGGTSRHVLRRTATNTLQLGNINFDEGLLLTGNVTASGNISSSGTIIANAFTGTLTGTATGLAGSPSILTTNITASGNISSSGNLIVSQSLTFGGDDVIIDFGNKLTIGNTNENEAIKIVDEQIKFIVAGGEAMILNDGTDKILIGYGGGISQTVIGSGANQMATFDSLNQRIFLKEAVIIGSGSLNFGTIHAENPDIPLVVSGSSKFYGNITSSGNISSSASGSFKHLFVSGTLSVGSIVAESLSEHYSFVNGNISASFISITSLGHLQADRVDIIGNTGLNVDNHITASGNISASGNIIGTNLIANSASFSTRVTLNDAKVTNSDQDLSALAITGSDVIFNHITASGNISSSGDILAKSFRVQGKTAISYNTSNTRIIYGQNNQNFRARGATILLGEDTTQHITASGNISASGTIVANKIESDRLFSHVGDANTGIQLGSDTVNIEANDVIIGKFTSNKIELNQPVTASGNISSSGDVYASDYYASGYKVRPNLYWFAVCDEVTVAANDSLGAFPSTDVSIVSFDATTLTSDAAVFVLDSDEVEITRAGVYKFTYNVLLEINAGNNRTEGAVGILRDRSSTIDFISGSRSSTYNRFGRVDSDDVSRMAGSVSMFIDVAANDKFYIGFYKEAHQTSNTILQTVTSGTTWTIEAVT